MPLNGENPLFGLREPVCTLTHFVALIWSIYAALLLIRLCKGQPEKLWPVGCFGASMVLLFAASTLYHAVIAPPETVAILRRIDMSMVYVLIAGTYAPAIGVLPYGRLKTGLTVLMWGLAVFGIAVRWLLPGDGFQLNVALYLLMGWLGLWPLVAIARYVGTRGVLLAIAGGLFYTIGAICDVLRWPVMIPGYVESHQVLHILGFAGTVLHFAFVMLYIIPYRPAPEAESASASLATEV